MLKIKVVSSRSKILATHQLSLSPNLVDEGTEEAGESCACACVGVFPDHDRTCWDTGLGMDVCLQIGAQTFAGAAIARPIAGQLRAGVAIADPISTEHARAGRNLPGAGGGAGGSGGLLALGYAEHPQDRDLAGSPDHLHRGGWLERPAAGGRGDRPA